MIRRVTVLGAGTMGHGIAHAAISAGYETRVFDVSPRSLEKGHASIQAIVAKGVEMGKVTADDAETILARLVTTGSLEHAVADADFVIEAAPERIDLKLRLFADIQRFAPERAV